MLALVYIFALKDAVLVPRLLGLVRRPLDRHPGLLKVGNKKLTKLRRRQQRERQESKRFNEQNEHHA